MGDFLGSATFVPVHPSMNAHTHACTGARIHPSIFPSLFPHFFNSFLKTVKEAREYMQFYRDPFLPNRRTSSCRQGLFIYCLLAGRMGLRRFDRGPENYFKNWGFIVIYLLIIIEPEHIIIHKNNRFKQNTSNFELYSHDINSNMECPTRPYQWK